MRGGREFVFLIWVGAVLAVLCAVPVSQANSIKPSFELIEGLIDTQQFEQASDLLDKVEVRGPAKVTAGEVDLLRGRIFLGMGNPVRAIECFEKASTSSLDVEARATLYIAEARLGQGKVIQARHSAQMALRSDPDLSAAEYVLAETDKRVGHGKEAIAHLQTLRKSRPDDEGVTIAFARFLVQVQGQEAGITMLRDFLRDHPESPGVQDALGGLLWAGGHKTEALQARIAAGELYLSDGRIGRAAAMASWIKWVDGDGQLERQARGRPVDPPLRRETVPVSVERPSAPRHAPPSDEPPPPAAAPEPAVPTVALPPLAPTPNPVPQAEPTRPPPLPPEAQVLAPPPAEGARQVAIANPSEIPANPEPLPFAPGSSYLSGSGIVLEGGRLVVTNRHVIEGMAVVYVRNGTGHVRPARIVKISQEDDLALLEIEAPFPEAAVIKYVDMVDPAPGRSAVVMGFPMIDLLGDNQPALTEGIVAKITGLGNDPKTFQMTTKINRGNSGGPVFDRQGRLMGITVGQTDAADIYRKSGVLVENMNIGIKADRILRFLGKSAVANAGRTADIDLEDLYRQMLPRVVLVAAQK